MLTADPAVVIEEQQADRVCYRASDGRRWEVIGTCSWRDPSTWGPCGVGSPDPPPGPPEGRLDIPVSPGFRCEACPHIVVRDLGD